MVVGEAVGAMVVGETVVGDAVGAAVSVLVGVKVVGDAVGEAVGVRVVGLAVGATVGDVGDAVGAGEGVTVSSVVNWLGSRKSILHQKLPIWSIFREGEVYVTGTHVRWSISGGLLSPSSSAALSEDG
eukprot:9473105-Pyramimonas_sp.AAC.1